MADSAACRRVVATFSHYSPERVVSLAILGGFAVLYLGMLARRACALRRHRSRPRSEDTADKLTPDAGGRAAGESPHEGGSAAGDGVAECPPRRCCSSVRALASRAAIGSRSTFHLLVAAYIIRACASSGRAAGAALPPWSSSALPTAPPPLLPAVCTFWYFHPFQPFLGQARNAAFGLAMQGFFHFSCVPASTRPGGPRRPRSPAAGPRVRM